ncbi:hypothetical protein CLI64_11270 [Nostoc sp. CENA543]|uniref:DUF4091 domain-containing protein n=1 Tax=Nostoc sp. CENA543 TaxID=1869241 RepID=UPI000CA2FE9D|nr:DUF4091 domain-containing protein [Nostoc sp. CENA543]AUT00935.1 hypothetical protein CLI64_11270 [Nostoc sp. CENA543]
MFSISQGKRKFIYKFKILIWILGTTLALYTISSLGILANNSSSKVPLIWVSSPMERIGKTGKPESATEIQLYAARGEYESFQISIHAPNGGLTNVNISVSDLLNNNQVISQRNITLYREHYVYVSHPSLNEIGSNNPSLGRGWYADGLIPFVNPETQAELTGAELDAVPFNLKAGNNQPIWVDIFVPRDANPGQYQGTFTVTSNQGISTGKIRLKVWDFELPIKPSLNSEFDLYEHENKPEMIEILKHKIMPQAHHNPVDERELIDNWGLTSHRLPFWSGADFNNCSMTPPPSVDEIHKATTKHQSDLFLYARYADEIDRCSNLIAPVKQWARNFHNAGISTAMAIAPTPALYDDGSGTGRSAVDIWVVLPQMYDANPQRISQVMQKGDKVWFYNALVQDDYSPKWQIDFQPINYRIPHGFINQSLGLTGVLYWRVDLWTKKPWKDVQTYEQNYPGEGMLVYPGKQVGIKGIVPSMRLKWIREGVEDYEYIEILKRLGRQNWALKVSRSVGLNWKTWTRDHKILESARYQLGEEIEKLSRQSRLANISE